MSEPEHAETSPAAEPQFDTAAKPQFDIVIPTIGRPCLTALLSSVAATAAVSPELVPGRVILVDDRRPPAEPLDVSGAGPLADRVQVIVGKAAGPASARNLGWRAATAPWVAFLDDDVVVPADWLRRLRADLAGAGPRLGASQGRIEVPLPADRRPTDWERNVAGLEHAQWATADMAYRRDVLAELGGFDERFPRAYREDADLGLRTVRAGYRIAMGDRCITHPVRPADRWVSVRLQRGNADDALMPALHGPDWRREALVPRGAFRRHVTTTAAGTLALAGAAAGNRRVAAAAGALWLAATARFAWSRIAPGPRTREEVSTMLLTSAVIPPAAVLGRIRGVLRRRRLLAVGGPTPVGALPGSAAFAATEPAARQVDQLSVVDGAS